MRGHVERRDYLETMKASVEAERRFHQTPAPTRRDALGQRLRALLARKGPTLGRAGAALHREGETARRWGKGPARGAVDDLGWVAEVYGVSGGALWG